MDEDEERVPYRVIEDLTTGITLYEPLEEGSEPIHIYIFPKPAQEIGGKAVGQRLRAFKPCGSRG